MPPAARITDMHVCPKVDPGPVPHVGGPTTAGEGTVLIGYQPAARVGDSLLCVGPGASDSISQGEGTVIIGNKPAARLGDPTSHGGVLVAGCPTVIIGSSPQAQTIQIAAQNGTPFCEECAKRQSQQEAEEAPEADSPAPADAPQAAPPPPVLAAAPAAPKVPGLLPGEGRVGTFGELQRMGKRGDNLTPHHIPPDAYMKEKVPGYMRDKGISIMMEQPRPGTGGRHRRTQSYGAQPDLSLPPRQALARELRDARRIYQKDGLYTPEVRQGLMKVLEQNKAAWPGVFAK
ncbi:PAAR domain-containing protein [Pyxidicoccus sp. 3LG]